MFLKKERAGVLPWESEFYFLQFLCPFTSSDSFQCHFYCTIDVKCEGVTALLLSHVPLQTKARAFTAFGHGTVHASLKVEQLWLPKGRCWCSRKVKWIPQTNWKKNTPLREPANQVAPNSPIHVLHTRSTSNLWLSLLAYLLKTVSDLIPNREQCI